MMLEEFSEAAFGFAVAVHRRDIEVADAGFIGCVQKAKALATIERTHDGGAAIAKPRGEPTVVRKPDLVHKALRCLD
jgi:hypothetical protein